MTEKQAVQNILDTLGYTGAKVLFLSLWLEDINWHSENRKLQEALPFWFNEINKSEPNFTELQQHSIKSAQECVRGMVYIFGWGTKPSDWLSGGVGGAFVEELVDMIKNPLNK